MHQKRQLGDRSSGSLCSKRHWVWRLVNKLKSWTGHLTPNRQKRYLLAKEGWGWAGTSSLWRSLVLPATLSVTSSQQQPLKKRLDWASYSESPEAAFFFFFSVIRGSGPSKRPGKMAVIPKGARNLRFTAKLQAAYWEAVLPISSLAAFLKFLLQIYRTPP